MSSAEKALFIIAMHCGEYDLMDTLRLCVSYIYRRSDHVQARFIQRVETAYTIEYRLDGKYHNVFDKPAKINVNNGTGQRSELWAKYGRLIKKRDYQDPRFKCVTDYGIRVWIKK